MQSKFWDKMQNKKCKINDHETQKEEKNLIIIIHKWRLEPSSFPSCYKNALCILPLKRVASFAQSPPKPISHNQSPATNLYIFENKLKI
jgi:hypothetical protein